jgi:hypothetical protein
MDKITIIYGKEDLDKIEDIKSKSIEYQRYMKYSNSLNPFMVFNKKETDTHIYWSISEAMPMFNNKLFLRFKKKHGATYDKQKRTIKFWFGHNPGTSGNLLKHIIAHFELDWFSNLYQKEAVSRIMSTSILQRCVRGTISNPRQLAKAIISSKTNLRNSGLSPEALFKLFNLNSFYIPSIDQILYYVPSIKQPDLYIDYLVAKDNYQDMYADIMSQARILGKKIDMTWSEKRLKEEHNIWTREIMALSILSVEEHDYEYTETAMPEGLEFIKTNYELFEEGTVMKHCIYTNYAARIKQKVYFGLRYERDGVRATVGIEKINDWTGNLHVSKFCLNQMYSKGNAPVDDVHKDIVREWLDKPETQEYFNLLSTVKEEEKQSYTDLWV